MLLPQNNNIRVEENDGPPYLVHLNFPENNIIKSNWISMALVFSY